MNFELSSDHKLVYESALEFSREHFGPLVEKMEQDDVWPTLIDKKSPQEVLKVN